MPSRFQEGASGKNTYCGSMKETNWKALQVLSLWSQNIFHYRTVLGFLGKVAISRSGARN